MDAMLDAPLTQPTPHSSHSDQTLREQAAIDLVRSLTWIEAPDIPDAGELPVHPGFVPPGEGFCDIPIFEHFQKVAAICSSSVAIHDGTARMTYGQLLARSRVLVQRIKARVPQGEAVGIFLADPSLFPLAALGCFAARRPFIALDRNSPTERNRYILEQSGVQFMILDSPVESIPPALSILVTSIDIAGEDGLPSDQEEAGHVGGPNATDQPAFILYTSGSTGHPKGIVGSERGLLERIRQHVIACKITSEDVCLPLSSPCTIAGNREIFSALLTGATLMTVEPQKAGLRGLRMLIRDGKVTFINTVPALIRSILTADGPDSDFASVRLVRLNGDRVLWSDLMLLKQKMPHTCFRQVAYSSTETTGTFWYPPREFGAQAGTVPIGMMHSGVRYALRTADGRTAEPGEEGELIIRSPFMALGHWRNGTCVPGPIMADPELPNFRIFETGDLVRFIDGHLIEFVGRKDRQIKIDGQRVEPAELEVLLRQSPDVADVAVIPSTLDGDVALVGFVVPLDAANTGLTDTLRRLIKSQLPKQLHPRTIHLLDAIPRLPSGKQDTPSLIRIDQAAHDAEASKADASKADITAEHHVEGSAAAAIERAWKKTLKLGAIEWDKSWDSAGGTSLKLLRFIFQLENELDRKLPLDIASVDMTPRTLDHAIRALDGQEQMSAISSPNDQATHKRPLIFLFPGLTGENPSLTALRRDLEERFDVVSITYPVWREMTLGRKNFDLMTENALRQVLEHSPEGELDFIGYSLGGSVAFNVAQRVLAMGRSIGRFCVLDNDVSGKSRASGTRIADGMGRLKRALAGDLGEDKTLYQTLSQLAGLGLARPISWPLLHLMTRSNLPGLSPENRFILENEIWEALQRSAFLNWLVSDPMHPLPVPIFLVRSEEPRPGAPADLGWGVLTPFLSIVPVNGTHISMLRPPNRDAVRNAITAYFTDQAPYVRHAAE
jgi:acyl-coenzyme A synthetase/AMP-(fatty) acid ligase/thioesterase domain-containing protein